MQLELDLAAALADTEPQSDGYEPVKAQGAEAGRALSREIIRIIERGGPYFQSDSETFSLTLEVIEAAVLYEEDKYMALIAKMRPEAVQVCKDVMGQLLRMYTDTIVCDVLGPVYMEVASRWKCSGLGQFFTPSDLCELMARVTLGSDVLERVKEARSAGKKLTISDPCLGSGAQLLAAKRVVLEQAGYQGLRNCTFSGQDIDQTCVRMAKIQLTLTDFWWMQNRMICAAADVRRQQK